MQFGKDSNTKICIIFMLLQKFEICFFFIILSTQLHHHFIFVTGITGI